MSSKPAAVASLQVLHKAQPLSLLQVEFYSRLCERLARGTKCGLICGNHDVFELLLPFAEIVLFNKIGASPLEF
jgi:hypothetical protein